MLEKLMKNKHLNSLDKKRPVVLALSGGVDSMVLFDLLKRLGFMVVIAHVNHHKRRESEIEEKYIKKMALEYGCEVMVYDYYHESNNFQAEAHSSRYNFFKEVAIKYNASSIITAHHYQDNLETIIMNMIKGSNLYGYSGIKEVSYYDDILVLRPLIDIKKDEIYEYAKDHNIHYFEDSSNKEDLYLRNRIRHHIIPLLEKENPNLSNSIRNYSNQLHEAFSYIRNNSIKYMEENDNKIDVISFNKLALIQKKDIINYICDLWGILSSDNKINDVLELIENSKPNLIYDLGDNFQFIKAYNLCYVTKKQNKENLSLNLNVSEEINFKELNLSLKQKITSDTYLKISTNEPMPLIIRNRLDGDKLIIGNGHKKLKDFLIDKKVPKNLRDDLVIVTNNEGEIIWVIGYYKKKCEEENCLILNVKEN